jgi:hypothetical protein
VTNPARRDSFLDTHVIVRRIGARPGWGAGLQGGRDLAVEIRDDRIIREWSRERGWVEEPVSLSVGGVRVPSGNPAPGLRPSGPRG